MLIFIRQPLEIMSFKTELPSASFKHVVLKRMLRSNFLRHDLIFLFRFFIKKKMKGTCLLVYSTLASFLLMSLYSGMSYKLTYVIQ